MPTEVAAKLDREQNYGIWWYNRRNVRKRNASELEEMIEQERKGTRTDPELERRAWLENVLLVGLPQRSD